MSRAAMALLLAALLVPAAAAQFVSRADVVRGGELTEQGRPSAELRIEMDEDPKMRMPQVEPWLVAGHDNLVNLSILNLRAVALNATFRINVTGGTATPNDIVLQAPANALAGATFVVHPDDAGVVTITAEAVDAFETSGEPIEASLELPALLLPSMRFLDPPSPAPSEDDEFVQVQMYHEMRYPGAAHIRIRPGESITPRIELTNPFGTTIAGFKLTLRVPGTTSPEVDVPPIEAGGSHVVEFPEFTPMDRSFGPSYGGPMGSYQLYPLAESTLAGATLHAGAVSFRVDRGAIANVTPTTALVEVQDGLAIDLFVPKTPVLGAPTRIKYNLTNLDTEEARGPLVITVMTPHRIFYDVQGPEVYQIAVELGPGERASGAVEFTPRVTGMWTATTFYRSPRGYGYGNGGSMEVVGPVLVAFDSSEQRFARIGEPVEVDITLASTDTLPDAQLRLGAVPQYYRDPTTATGASYRAGFASGLIDGRALTGSLGTLRPGGSVNTSAELVGRASGGYTVVPYVLAEGFAYTSTGPGDPQLAHAMSGLVSGAGTLTLVVTSRAVPPGLALAPLTVGLAFFVGAWTLRTRFVK